jgi:hypothetical protein
MRRVAARIVDLVRRQGPPAPVTVLEPFFENRRARGPGAVHDGAGPEEVDEAEGQLQRRGGDLCVRAVDHADPEVAVQARDIYSFARVEDLPHGRIRKDRAQRRPDLLP